MLVLIASAMLTAVPASAQPKPPTPYDRAIAAGYKALTLCSGIFNAGRTQAQIEALELTGIYPQYDAIVPTLDATIERGSYTGLVTVPFDPSLPPRAAVASFGGVCHILPIGMTGGLIEVNYRISPHVRAGDQDQKKWPQGEAAINATSSPKLAVATNAAFEERPSGVRTTGIVVVKNGIIVAERYAEGFDPHTPQRTWSVAKSISGTLMGIASYKKLIDIQKPADIPEWQTAGDPRASITIDQLLHMASGLHSDTSGNRTDAIYFGGTTVTEEATKWPIEAKPGTRFRYANNDILLSIRSLRKTLVDDQAYLRFPTTELFDKIGMTRTIAETDWQGNFILSSQVWSTARDLARFGLLYLNDGIWNGERILPQSWIKYVTTPSGPQPDGPFGYGATFWLMNNSPGVPADTYAAFGNRGQYVVIVPSRKIVIVRRGEDPTGASFDIATFTADILAALK